MNAFQLNYPYTSAWPEITITVGLLAAALVWLISAQLLSLQEKTLDQA